jgi:hypothetical protein
LGFVGRQEVDIDAVFESGILIGRQLRGPLLGLAQSQFDLRLGEEETQVAIVNKRFELYGRIQVLEEMLEILADQRFILPHGREQCQRRVVSVEIRDNTLFISGLENKSASFWERDLLSFLKDTVSTDSSASRKSSQWLKLLLKDYSINSRTVFHFLLHKWVADIRIPEAPVMLLHRALPVFSPPPEV